MLKIEQSVDIMCEEKKECDMLSLDDDSGTDELTIVSGNDKKFVVTKKQASVSRLLKTCFEQDSECREVPLPAVNSDALEKVVEYMVHHNGTEPEPPDKPLRSKDMVNVCKDKWDAHFFDEIGKNRKLLFDVAKAANYMDMHNMLHTACAKVASLIKGVPLEKIKEVLDPNLVETD